eukprot:g10265.t1
MRPIVGIRKLTSAAKEGSGVVKAELHSDVDDPERVLNEIRGAVDRISTFPQDAEKPEVKLAARFQSVVSVALLAPEGLDPQNDPVAERQFRELGEQVREDLLAIPGISHVDLWQAKPYQIDIEISEDTLRKYNLTHADIREAVRRGNVELPGGEIKSTSGDLLIRTANKRLTGPEIARIPVISKPNGAVLTLGELGTVRDGFADVDVFAFIDGRAAMSIKLRMTNDEDMLSIRDKAARYVADKQLPPGFDIKVWDDYSGIARERLELLMNSGLVGLLLVFLVLGFFLDLRLAFWVALGIPISVFGTCAIMYAVDASINIHSMFAFVMVLGIVVDDAIVIAENVYAHRLRGKSGFQAAVDGTAEVAPAVMSSVLTTVIAFIPLAFVTGEMGKWISVMPLVLIAMLLISLVEALFILPCHLAHSELPARPADVPRFQRFIQRAVDGFIGRVYTPAFFWSLKNRGIVFSGSVSALLVSAGLYFGGFTPFKFSRQLDWAFVYTYVDYPKGTPTETIDAATKRLEKSFRETEREQFASYDGSLTQTFYRGVGYTNQLDNKRGEVYAGFERDRMFRGQSSREFVSRWRERAGDFPGAERVVFWGVNNAPGGSPIELSLLSSDTQRLETITQQIKDRLATYAGVVDIRDSRGLGKWELQLKLRPEAESLGIRLEEIARTVRAAFHGDEVMRLQRGRHEVKLMVRYPPNERRTLHQLDEIRVRTPAGDEVPLRELAEVNVRRGYATIHRIDQQRAVTITANVDEQMGNAPEIIQDLRDEYLTELLESEPLVQVRWEGQQEQTRQSFNSLVLGFVIALFGMFAVLTLQFRSAIQPLIILAVLPFGFVGAILGHLILGEPMTLFSLFGDFAR